VKALSIVGTRPQLIKLAPISRAFIEINLRHEYVDTGQHYDSTLTDLQSLDLKLPAPYKNLSIGSASHAAQTAKMLIAIDAEIERYSPDVVLVYGDTNSTLAAALAAAKRFIPILHIEAGLRSFNRKMPEEINRIAVDHLSTYLFAPTQTALEQLNKEGLGTRSILVGDVMADLLRTEIKTFNLANRTATSQPYYLCTIHRAENTDDIDSLKSILESLGTLKYTVLLSVHPRLRDKIKQKSLRLPKNVTPIEPVAHSEMMKLVIGSEGVITDSGGLQKECYILEKLCTTLRVETEWIETLQQGWNVLVTNYKELWKFVERETPSEHLDFYGDGSAAQKIVTFIERTYT
jgi:UDP-N-acetylglucosamine 2-epimerase (non-hydrolysing)